MFPTRINDVKITTSIFILLLMLNINCIKILVVIKIHKIISINICEYDLNKMNSIVKPIVFIIIRIIDLIFELSNNIKFGIYNKKFPIINKNTFADSKNGLMLFWI